MTSSQPLPGPEQHKNQLDGKIAEIKTVNWHAELTFAIWKIKCNDSFTIYVTVISDL